MWGCGQTERGPVQGGGPEDSEHGPAQADQGLRHLRVNGDTGPQGLMCHNSAFQLASTWHTVKLHSYFSFSLHTKFDILIGCFNLKNSSEGLISPWQPGSPRKRKPSAQHRRLFRLTQHRAEEVRDLVWGGQLHALRERWGAALPSWKTGPPFQSPLFPCK